MEADGPLAGRDEELCRGEAGTRPAASKHGPAGLDGRWRRARSEYLAEHPWCVRCLIKGRRTPATVVDHVEPHRDDERLFWDRDQWQVLCKPHHDAKTVRDGRWGQRHLSNGAARSIPGCDVHGMPLDPDHPWDPPGGVGGSWRIRR